MKLPIAITFHGFAPADWIEADIRKRAAKLDTYCGDIMLCRVTVDLPHRHHRGGNRFSVRIDLTVPGEELAVTRDANLHASQKALGKAVLAKQFEVEGMRKDFRLVIKEAFDVARRRLQDYARRHRLDVKRHEEPLVGRVTQWSPIDEFGTIEAADGHEIYFHRNSVLPKGLKRLGVGAEVAFEEEKGRKGPQATTVRLLRAGAVRAVA